MFIGKNTKNEKQLISLSKTHILLSINQHQMCFGVIFNISFFAVSKFEYLYIILRTQKSLKK
jgi:hypothetical protein